MRSVRLSKNRTPSTCIRVSGQTYDLLKDLSQQTGKAMNELLHVLLYKASKSYKNGGEFFDDLI